MSIYNVTIESLDGTAKEDIALAVSTMQDFTTVKRPDMNNAHILILPATGFVPLN